LPVYGLHLPLCLAACLPLRLDVIVAYAAAHISNPLFAPFLITAEIQVGSLLLTGGFLPFDVARARAVGVSGFVAQAAVGSVVVGATLSVVGALVTYVVGFIYGRRKNLALHSAIRRTVRRYAGAARSDRGYVAVKLRTDPVLACLAKQPGSFGRLVDAGAGRGQLALCLFELGKAESVFGFDWDTKKVKVASLAGRDDAEFIEGDLRCAPWRAADTILLVDVLHYLSSEEQDHVLTQALRHLAPGGRLLVREVDGRSGWRTLLTQLFERLGRQLGVNRGLALAFRSAREIAAELGRRGLEVQSMPASQNTPLANVLIAARKSAEHAELEPVSDAP
jgi:SAM-dependent methyltransferase